MNKHRLRCSTIKEFSKIFDKMLSDEIKKAPVNIEELSQRIIKKLGVKDPATKFVSKD